MLLFLAVRMQKRLLLLMLLRVEVKILLQLMPVLGHQGEAKVQLEAIAASRGRLIGPHFAGTEQTLLGGQLMLPMLRLYLLRLLLMLMVFLMLVLLFLRSLPGGQLAAATTTATCPRESPAARRRRQ